MCYNSRAKLLQKQLSTMHTMRNAQLSATIVIWRSIPTPQDVQIGHGNSVGPFFLAREGFKIGEEGQDWKEWPAIFSLFLFFFLIFLAREGLKRVGHERSVQPFLATLVALHLTPVSE